MKGLKTVFPKASEDALSLLKDLLEFNPAKRITAEEALFHPYLHEFHNINDEPSADKCITLLLNDNKKYSIREYRDSLY